MPISLRDLSRNRFALLPPYVSLHMSFREGRVLFCFVSDIRSKGGTRVPQTAQQTLLAEEVRSLFPFPNAGTQQFQTNLLFLRGL